MDRITSFPWDFVLIGKMLGTLSHWKHSLTERNPPPLQNSISIEKSSSPTNRSCRITDGFFKYTNLSFLQCVDNCSVEKEKCYNRKNVEEKETWNRITCHYCYPHSKYYRFENTYTILKIKEESMKFYQKLSTERANGVWGSALHSIEVFRIEILAACQPASLAKRPKCRSDSYFWIHEFRNNDHCKHIV